MAKIHVLDGGGTGNLFTVVIHGAPPAGNNDAGFAWADAIKNAGLAQTSMTIGNGAGQIPQNEANQIASASIIEAVMQWQDDPSWTDTQRNADLDLRATQLLAEAQDNFRRRLRLWVKTRD